MKKYFCFFLIVMFVGAISWAQGTKDLFDVKKSQKELDIMKGILGTTLSYVAQSLQQSTTAGASAKTRTTYSLTGSFRSSNITAFYLYGQGAVFIFPSSSLRFSNVFAVADWSHNLVASTDAIRAYASTMQDYGVVLAREVEEAAKSQSGAAAKAPPTKKVDKLVDREELKKKLAEVQEMTRKSREEAEAAREGFMKTLGEIKGYLIEALADYGDSLTTVKPNEYITLVLSTGDGDLDFVYSGSEERSRREIISVQKAWVTDYKAGRLTLDAFKQKAIQYSN